MATHCNTLYWCSASIHCSFANFIPVDKMALPTARPHSQSSLPPSVFFIPYTLFICIFNHIFYLLTRTRICAHLCTIYAQVNTLNWTEWKPALSWWHREKVMVTWLGLPKDSNRLGSLPPSLTPPWSLWFTTQTEVIHATYLLTYCACVWVRLEIRIQ